MFTLRFVGMSVNEFKVRQPRGSRLEFSLFLTHPGGWDRKVRMETSDALKAPYKCCWKGQGHERCGETVPCISVRYEPRKRGYPPRPPRGIEGYALHCILFPSGPAGSRGSPGMWGPRSPSRRRVRL